MYYSPSLSARQTGPKTLAGKAIAARNATTHGLFARDVVLPHLGEDPEAYNALLQQLCAELQPRTLLEQHYVEQIAAASWRLRRLDRWQAQTFDNDALTEEQRLNTLDRLLRHETTLRRQIDKAARALERRETAETNSSETNSSAHIPAPMPPDFDPARLDNTYETEQDRIAREAHEQKCENEMAEQAKEYQPTYEGFHVYPGGRPAYVTEREWEEVCRLCEQGQRNQARKKVEECRRACIDRIAGYLESDREDEEKYGTDDDEDDEEDDDDPLYV